MSLTAKKVSILRAGNRLLETVDLSIAPGQITALLGPNGAGKSTTLRALSGEWRVNSGEVYLEDSPLAAWPSELRAQRLGVLPQTSSLEFSFACNEVVNLGRIPHANGVQVDREIVRQALALVDATALASRLYTELSGGEKQRVQLARVIAQVWSDEDRDEPRYLLLDEPIAALDLEHQALAAQLIRRLKQKNIGILAIVHDLNFASQLADTMVLMDAGRVVASGTPEEVMTPETIKRIFKIEASIVTHPVSAAPYAIV